MLYYVYSKEQTIKQKNKEKVMGNRAVITTKEKKIGIYLHWNGGRDSVEPFLAYCKLRGHREPENDCYGWARLCQVIGNYLGSTTSIGIDTLDNLDCDNWDNGTYIIKNWEIVGREYFNGDEQKHYDFNEMLRDINEAQPKAEQMDIKFFDAKEVETKDLIIGDKVYIQHFDDRHEVFNVVGIGTRKMLNGHNVIGVPYTDKYGEDNINSYLLRDSYRVI